MSVRKILSYEGWYYIYEDGKLSAYGEDLEELLGIEVDYDTAYCWDDPDNPPQEI